MREQEEPYGARSFFAARLPRDLHGHSKIFGVEDLTGRITLRIQWLAGHSFELSFAWPL